MSPSLSGSELPSEILPIFLRTIVVSALTCTHGLILSIRKHSMKLFIWKSGVSFDLRTAIRMRSKIDMKDCQDGDKDDQRSEVARRTRLRRRRLDRAPFRRALFAIAAPVPLVRLFRCVSFPSPF